ncbi:MAG: hypothetical protein UV60_C0027G0007 [Parcubacteria group bacterium GW2011_GWA2_43_11]|nr:MAG: hypothetical protein UU89_C0034G0004 [Parcubacteria group bacterium GW2011_GWC2_42_11]KKS84176.1 MAG: hypothetical protein UV60_C0027G0007 [Parcubacteria group bacterium GW2011_GWA2_43_11]
MEPKFNTSFIPKKSLQADVSGAATAKNRFVRRRDVHGPGYYLMFMVFLTSVVVSLGVFGYTKIVESNIQEKIARLERQKEAFDEETVAMLARADTHITNAKKILKEHIAVSELFTLLETITLIRVQYTEFEYTGEPNQTALATISGLSKNFQDVALQTEQYRLHPSLHKPVVRELERLEDNAVSFSIDVTADTGLISFSSALKNMSQQVVVPTPTPAVESTTTLEVDASLSSAPSTI